MVVTFPETLGTDLERRLVGTVLQHVISGLIQCERGICHPLTGDDIQLLIRATRIIRQITIGLIDRRDRRVTAAVADYTGT